MVTLTPVSEHSHAERLSRRIELSAEELSLLLGPDRFAPAPTLAPGESSETVRQRVEAVRKPQLQRQSTVNARLSDKNLESCCVMTAAAAKLLASTIKMQHLSARAIQRVRRVARTCADLSGAPQIDVPHLAEAFQYRPVFSAGLR